MDIQISIIPKNCVTKINSYVETEDSMVDGFNIIYYCHGICIANKYSDEKYDERLMLTYLNQKTKEVSKTTELTCYYIDFYEQASIPIIRIDKIVHGSHHSISEQQINIDLDINIMQIVTLLNEQFRAKIASS